MTAHGCTLAIVGSRQVPRYLAESLIKTAILEHAPTMVVSGGATGVDQFAVEIAHTLDVATIEFLPETPQWDAQPKASEPREEALEHGLRVVVPGGFKARNQKIAEACDCLVRIGSVSSKTYGSGWTADQAERLGKQVIRHVV